MPLRASGQTNLKKRCSETSYRVVWDSLSATTRDWAFPRASRLFLLGETLQMTEGGAGREGGLNFGRRARIEVLKMEERKGICTHACLACGWKADASLAAGAKAGATASTQERPRPAWDGDRTPSHLPSLFKVYTLVDTENASCPLLSTLHRSHALMSTLRSE